VTVLVPGSRRLLVARALLGGGAAAIALPGACARLGGSAADAVAMCAAFALGAACTEWPAARALRSTDVAGLAGRTPRAMLVQSALLQSVALVAMAYAPSRALLAVLTAAAGAAAGLATGAEARASLAVGRDAAAVARIEVGALVGKALVTLAVVAMAGAGATASRTMLLSTAASLVLAAAVASTIRRADRVMRGDGRRVRGATSAVAADALGLDERRVRGGDRRSASTVGVVALLGAALALSLAARGSDALDVVRLHVDGAAPLLAASLLVGKSWVAAALGPWSVRGKWLRLMGLATFGAAAFSLLAVSRVGVGAGAGDGARAATVMLTMIAAGVCAGAAASARALLLVRIGPERAGAAAALEATARRWLGALGSLSLAGSLYAAPSWAAALAMVGAVLAMTPRIWRRREAGAS
jgi:hypothetical protein